MKKIIQLISLCIIITSCELQKLTELQDNFQISVDAEPVYNIKNIKILNAKSGSEINSNINITLSGANADKIYTSSGSKNLLVDNGSISIEVNRNFIVSSDNPLEILATITSDGYFSKEINLLFDGSESVSMNIGLLEKMNLPDNIEYIEKNIALNNGSINSDITISFDSNSNNSLDFNFKQGTKFLDENGNTINGTNLKFEYIDYGIPDKDFAMFSYNSQNPISFLKYEQTPIDLFDISNNVAAKSIRNSTDKFTEKYLLPLSSPHYKTLYLDGKRVKSFSEPTIVQQFIRYRDVINPITNEKIKEGDNVQVIHKYNVFINGKTTPFVEKKEAIIKKHSWRGLFVEYEVDNSYGYQLIGFEMDTNHNCNTIDNIDFKNDGINTTYNCIIYHKSNPNLAIAYHTLKMSGESTFGVKGTNFFTKSKYKRINTLLSQLGENMILKIYKQSFENDRYGKSVLVYDKEVSICELNNQIIDITNDDCADQKEIDFVVECPDNTSYSLGSFINLEYWEVDSAGNPIGWGRPYATVKFGQLYSKTPCLEPEQDYKFEFYYDKSYTTEALKGKQVDSLFTNFDQDRICRAIQDR